MKYGVPNTVLAIFSLAPTAKLARVSATRYSSACGFGSYDFVPFSLTLAFP